MLKKGFMRVWVITIFMNFLNSRIPTARLWSQRQYWPFPLQFQRNRFYLQRSGERRKLWGRWLQVNVQLALVKLSSSLYTSWSTRYRSHFYPLWIIITRKNTCDYKGIQTKRDVAKVSLWSLFMWSSFLAESYERFLAESYFNDFINVVTFWLSENDSVGQ